MNKEIERKFLVSSDDWRKDISESFRIQQCYLSENCDCMERVRIIGESGFLTIKSKTDTFALHEFEYRIPLEDAKFLFEKVFTGGKIDKIRHIVNFCGERWEIDEFAGKLKGLVVAEIELASETAEFQRPGWLGKEVTGDPAYSNFALSLKK